MNEDTYVSQKNLQQDWDELYAREETYWRQKSRELWLQDGDRNTKKIHVSAKQKRVNNSIFQIKDVISSDLLLMKILFGMKG